MKVLMKLLCLCLLTGCTTNTIFVNQQNNTKKTMGLCNSRFPIF
ncbi:hypothetical protein [Coprobacillus cateniformis]|nr:hypothetical protein [Coprobacillus cateniformis]